MKLYGIANCNTVKKAREWLSGHGQQLPFHDFKKEGIDRELVDHFLARSDWQTLVNRKGLTWRALSENEKATDETSARELMLKKPSVIKRPILDTAEGICVGFEPARYAEILGIHE